MIRKVALAIVAISLLAISVWAAIRYVNHRRSQFAQVAIPPLSDVQSADPNAWNRAVERVKEFRADTGGGLQIPAELKHYEERYWFLAAQVAEVEKHQVH